MILILPRYIYVYEPLAFGKSYQMDGYLLKENILCVLVCSMS